MKNKQICEFCKDEFHTYKTSSKYCSKKCQYLGSKLKSKICPVCKKEFQPKKSKQIHCDIQCYSKSEKLNYEAKNSKLIKNNEDNKYHLGHLKTNVGYGALHDWVRYHKEKTGLCYICGSNESGYKDRDFDLANISGEYKRDIDDFVWLCQRCHRKFDKIKRKQPYIVMGVEAKSNGYLDKIEKAKCQWLLANKVFNKILIAKKKKEGRKIVPEYIEFKV